MFFRFFERHVCRLSFPRTRRSNPTGVMTKKKISDSATLDMTRSSTFANPNHNQAKGMKSFGRSKPAKSVAPAKAVRSTGYQTDKAIIAREATIANSVFCFLVVKVFYEKTGYGFTIYDSPHAVTM